LNGKSNDDPKMCLKQIVDFCGSRDCLAKLSSKTKFV